VRRLAVVTTALALALSLAGPGAAQPAVTDEPFRLGGVRVDAGPGTRQVITVNATSGYHAVVSLWVRRDGRWDRTATTRSGRIGYGGLVVGSKRRQGTGTTPMGTYSITETFGNAPRGSGIFLHVNGAGATAGCVSVPRRLVRNMMSRLRPGMAPVIAIGR
jgi:L,D-peptidoglycan transpeptidase YkuD (ErfK/YbiS/YcfS/YnhG family)